MCNKHILLKSEGLMIMFEFGTSLCLQNGPRVITAAIVLKNRQTLRLKRGGAVGRHMPI